MSLSNAEEPLLDGNVATGLVRIGNTVRRPVGPWSPSVDALLLHLERAGYEGSPRALGYDGLGRQALSCAEGHIDPNPADLDQGQLVEVARMIRGFHDAVASFAPQQGQSGTSPFARTGRI